MVFADDERKSNPTGFAFLQAAHLWKQRQAQAQSQGGGVVANLVANARLEDVVENTQADGTESSDDEMENGDQKLPSKSTDAGSTSSNSDSKH